MNNIVEYTLRIGFLTRKIRLTPLEWGIYVVIEDLTDGIVRPTFTSKNFSYTQKFPTYTELVKRIERLYNINAYKIA